MDLVPYRFDSFLIFNAFEFIFSFFMNQKLSRNAAALTHAMGAVTLSAMHIYQPSSHIYDLCTIWSTGYFLYDTVFMLRNEKLDVLRLGYMYHHLAAIYIIHYPPRYYYGDIMIFWGELSNIPSYFVYYYLHTLPTSSKLIIWKNIQKFVYGGIRIPILTWLTASVVKNAPNKMPVIVALPIYLMGLMWARKLCNK